MSNSQLVFPEGVASGESFINRVDERNQLIARIKQNQHTVLMAPRRYGKTSLVIKVSNEMKIPYSALDFLAAYSEEYVRDQIVDKVSHLVFQLLPAIKQAKEKLLAIFARMKPEISVGAFGQRLILHLSQQPLKDITEILLKLDETAVQFNKHAVVFMDEFQQISQLKHAHSIEASIRHAVERSRNIAYVFSGSNRRLLKQMFADNSRPLYRLCQTVTLERMEELVYVDHLQKLAKQKWKSPLNTDVLEHIFFLTELHPYYMNVLCQLLWNRAIPKTAKEIEDVWMHYVKIQRHMISHDVGKLSVNQRKIMVALARKNISEIQSIDFVSALKISPSSAQQATAILLKADMLFRDQQGVYRILDPAVKYYLNNVLWETQLPIE